MIYYYYYFFLTDGAFDGWLRVNWCQVREVHTRWWSEHGRTLH